MKIEVFLFILTTGVLCHASLEISQGVVFQLNGTLDIFCSTSDFYISPEIIFIWHHNESRGEYGQTNYRAGMPDRLYYRLHKDTATQNDTGTYECNIEGRPKVVSMTATMVQVHDTPLVGRMGETLDVPLLKDVNAEIQCYAVNTGINYVEDCVKHIQVTDITVSKNHKFVIASKKAVQYYGTIENAIHNKTTFNISRAVIGLEATDKDEKITLTFRGNKTIIENLHVECSSQTQKLSLNVSKGPSYDSTIQTFVCNRNGTKSEVVAEVSWKGRSLDSFKFTPSGAEHATLADLKLWVILAAVHLYSYKLW